MNYHSTVEDAERFILWYITNEPDVTDWDKTRYTNAVEMVKASNRRYSRDEASTALSDRCDIAFARMVVMWIKTEPEWSKLELPYLKAYERHLEGERSLDHLREMERLTAALKSPSQS